MVVLVSLIVAEKPSVARDLARVLKVTRKGEGCFKGNKVWITWCIGHVAELCEPAEYDPAWKAWSTRTLPMLPEDFKLRPSKNTRDHWKKLKALLRHKEVDQVINGCDAGREGELIFRYAYDLAGCRRPVRRLWLSSLTDQAIKQGLKDMRPGADFDALADAARCRSEADWLIGLNATRALTLFGRRHGHSELLSVGRVQTPTLAMLVEREEAIEAFVPEPFWQVYATFEVEHGLYEGLWTREPGGPAYPPPKGASEHDDNDKARNKTKARGKTPKGKQTRRHGKKERGQDTRLGLKQDAETIQAAIDGQTGEIRKVDQRRVKERQPLLYDLTQLQRAANRRYGFSAARTLAIAQALYEKHKLITYPRTDSNYLTTDMVAGLPKIVRGIDVGPYSPFCQTLLNNMPLTISKRIVDNKEVGDHHAIIPTGRTPKLERLEGDEQRIFDLVARRFIAVFFPPAIFATTRIESLVAKHLFVTRGRVCIDPGWQTVEPPSKRGKNKKDDGQGKAPEQDLPVVNKGEPAAVRKHRLHQGTTQPPRRYNEASLLGAMERAGAKLDDDELRRAMKEAGLGTPATRASIIETLIRRQFVKRQGKTLVPTPRGAALVHAVPVEDLKSARLTGAWEARLTRIADGRMTRADFMAEVRDLAKRLIPDILNASGDAIAASATAPAEALGQCPICNTPVTEGRKAYSCQQGRDCSFVIFKTVASRKISPSLVKVLLNKRHSKVLKGFKSKAGKRFEAALVLKPDGTVGFNFDGKASARAPQHQRHSPGLMAGPPAPLPPEAYDTPPTQTPTPTHTEEPTAAHSTPRDNTSQTRPPVTCPSCQQGHIIKGRRGWGCSQWRSGCRFVIWFQQRGVQLSDQHAHDLLGHGHTETLHDIQDDDGQPVRARLVLDLNAENHLRLELQPPS